MSLSANTVTGNRRSSVGVAFALIVLYLTSVFGVWSVGRRTADRKTEEALEYACSDLQDNMELVFDGMLAIEAESIKHILKTPAARSVAEMQRLVAGCGLDELLLVGPDGKVHSSTESAAIGKDLSSDSSTVRFLVLTNASVASVRKTFGPSIGGGPGRRMYSGFPFYDGHFVLCGFDEHAAARLFANHESEMISTWQFGETGCFVVVDDATGRLVYDPYGHEGSAGMTLAEIGLGAAASQADDFETTHRAVVFGEPSYYRVYHYLGLRILPVVTHDEFYQSVKNTTLMTSLVLLVVFAIFLVAFNRAAAASRAIAALRAADDAKREKDMLMATSIQKHSLPSVFPPFPNMVDVFDIHAYMDTAKEVGGDFYDFYFIGPGKVALVIADVSGKGIPAAMFMMRAKATLQGLLKGGADLATAVSETNDRLCAGNADGMFVTAWVGVYDIHTGELAFVNAGHNPPILARIGNAPTWVRERSGLPLATMEGVPYKRHSMKLAPGDFLFLYTDGVTEAQDATNRLYGESRLEFILRGLDSRNSCQEVCSRVYDDVERFVNGAPQADDITVLAFRVKRMGE